MGCPVCYGVNIEVDRRKAYLERIQTQYPGKSYVWREGYETAENRIIKLLHERVDWLLDQNTFERTAEAEIWLRAIALIKGENK